MKTAKSLWGVFMLLLLQSVSSQGQTSPDLPEIIPPSPEASAFNIYGELPISHYSGISNISIPIYQINHGDISLPISLSYQTAGIRVDQEASWVGLGWLLDAGGVISRTIVGKDDFHSPAYFSNPVSDLTKTFNGNYSSYVTDEIINTDCDFEYLEHLNIPDNLLAPNSAYDFQPDQFSYQFGSFSGKFVIKRDASGNPETIFSDSYDKLRIEPLFDAPNLTVDAWKITDPNGMVYLFEEMELYYGGSTPSPTSWYLTKISSPTGKSIELTYDRKTTNVQVVGALQSQTITPLCIALSGTGAINGCPTNIFSGALPQSPRNYNIPVLSEIDFGVGLVKFVSDHTFRQDVPNGNRLSQIDIYIKQEDGTLAFLPKKRFSLQYGYLQSSGTLDIDGATQFYPYTLEQLTWRMKLDKIVELSPDGSIPLSQSPVHSFSYIETPTLPAKTSLARDHWGYFNGRYSNDQLHAKFVGIVADSFHVFKEFDGADREADPTFSKAFTLERVNYPSGGSTQLVYEGNTYDFQASSIHDEYKDFVPDLDRRRFQGTGTFNQTQTFPFTIRGNAFPVASDGSARIKFQCTFVCDLLSGCPTTVDASQVSARIFHSDGTEVPNTVLSLSNSPCNNPQNTPCTDHQGEHNLGLAPGDYFVETIVTHSDVPYVSFTVEYDTIPNISQGGGLRVVEMITQEGSNPDMDIHRTFEYHFMEDRNGDGIEEEYSYGRRLSRPIYGRFIESTVWEDQINGGANTCVSTNTGSFSISANSLTSLTGYGGAIGYDQVSEFWGKEGQEQGVLGKTEYNFHNTPDVIRSYQFSRPAGIPNFPHEESRLNGRLKEKREFQYSGGGQYSIVQKTEYSYASDSTRIALMGIYQEAFGFQNNSSCQIAPAPCNALSIIYPIVTRDWPRLVSTTETVYDLNNGISLSKESLNVYDESLHLLRKQVMTNSDGNTKAIQYTYAEEGGLGVPMQMYEVNDPNYFHMPGSVVKTQSLFNGNEQSISLNLFSFDATHDRILLNKVQSFPNAGSEVVEISYEYDEASNMVEISRDFGQPSSYVWAHQQTRPISSATNASVDQIAFTSFEVADPDPSEHGSWTFSQPSGTNIGFESSAIAKTGKKVYHFQSGNSISRSNLPIGSYTINYWQRNGNVSLSLSGSASIISEKIHLTDMNSWELVEKQISISSLSDAITLSGDGIMLDELRLHPSDAHMSTICYDDALRIHTMTDANIRSSYYSYDAFGRLIEVRDHNGYVRVQTEYHYAD
ncbi:MAG: RHS repeat domain-containing protein [Bacteroidota bacterium]